MLPPVSSYRDFYHSIRGDQTRWIVVTLEMNSSHWLSMRREHYIPVFNYLCNITWYKVYSVSLILSSLYTTTYVELISLAKWLNIWISCPEQLLQGWISECRNIPRENYRFRLITKLVLTCAPPPTPRLSTSV